MTPLAVLLLALAVAITAAGAWLLQLTPIGGALIGIGVMVAFAAGRTERTWSKR